MMLRLSTWLGMIAFMVDQSAVVIDQSVVALYDAADVARRCGW